MDVGRDAMTPGVAIVGCGLIGTRRARALEGARVVACVDTDLARARKVAADHSGSEALDDWNAAIARDDVDAVVVATPHDALATITRAAIESGKHVLVEKPGARHVDELKALPGIAARTGARVRVGFNHRCHRALRKARELVDAGALGPLMVLRARYGHGGRVGYDQEWRARPAISGGGELIDQGVHLIDLARWFLGDFSKVEGFAATFFWNMPVDDNAFLLLRTAQERTAFLHASCTEWKNTFSFELYGREGKLQVDGLGGSYGTERLTWYRMLPQMGPPETTSWEYPMADDSWQVETRAFVEDIRTGREPSPGLGDAIAVLDVVDQVYRGSGHDHRA
jgi:predicted dehydrogenase